MTKLPKAPQNEGVDPLTKGKKYQDGENLIENSTLNDEPAQAEVEADTVIDEAGEVDLADVEKIEVPEDDEHIQTDSTPADDGADTAEAKQPAK